MASVISRCDDNGIYYITDFVEIGSDHTVVWFGANENGAWSNVFWGRYDRRNQVLADIAGEWWDVPMGRTQGHGTLEIRKGTWSARRTNQTGGFGGSTWRDFGVRSSSVDNFIPLAIGHAIDSAGLSGYWRSVTTNAHYYITQHDSTVVWFAGRDDRSAAHVFKGTRNGSRLDGEWIDVPYGRTRGRGQISYRIVEDPETGGELLLRRISATGGYATSLVVRAA